MTLSTDAANHAVAPGSYLSPIETRALIHDSILNTGHLIV